MLPDWLTPEMFCVFLAGMAVTCWTADRLGWWK